MSREAFGPNLRRIRVQQQLTLEEIAHTTKVPANLLAGLECNDFTDWPVGLFARAYVRQYANAIGVDPDATVNDFCRWFPEGDRRAERIVREHAEIVGHELNWEDQIPVEGDRRGTLTGPAAPRHLPSPVTALFLRVRRVFQRA